MQAVAALAELAIPHFTTRTIFSVANLGSKAKFYDNVQILAVSALHAAPLYTCAQHQESCLEPCNNAVGIAQGTWKPAIWAEEMFTHKGRYRCHRNSETLSTQVQLMQVLSVSYGLFAGLRGFLISLLNTQLIQNLR